ncbi:ABC transporter ATP-binding protein [Ruegeria sp. 2205SS24-7]|uniref:ABC transporter ATP-binding protein n=1 Tax=Ruegeria discodermiae TaxID=3064389 RepID=UPI0027426DF0|nr:ABC transporter ATP-binding protein [Ruegeria sp. 2205SS24-7]MDP5220010.1 ABC transporter ATP-binding protein [Ruegeria sp. 2205SS24-7]
MSIAHLLEDFDQNLSPEGTVQLLSAQQLEDQRRAAFEQGYAAGLDDAGAAQTAEQGRISADLAQSLQDLGFTYQEALEQMVASLEPMFQSLMNTVLPETIERSFVHRIVAQLTEMARDQAGQPAIVTVPAGAAETLTPALDAEFSFPVEMIEDASLPQGQASLRIGRDERELDCTALLDAISEATEAFLHHAKTETRHG